MAYFGAVAAKVTGGGGQSGVRFQKPDISLLLSQTPLVGPRIPGGQATKRDSGQDSAVVRSSVPTAQATGLQAAGLEA